MVYVTSSGLKIDMDKVRRRTLLLVPYECWDGLLGELDFCKTDRDRLQVYLMYAKAFKR